MSTWEWIGLFLFLIVVTLLFFAAFGGSNLDHQNIEEYMDSLLNEKKQEGQK